MISLEIARRLSMLLVSHQNLVMTLLQVRVHCLCQRKARMLSQLTRHGRVKRVKAQKFLNQRPLDVQKKSRP